MFKLFQFKDKKNQAITIEKNPFLFFGATILKTIVQPLFPKLHKNSRIDPDAVQQFVTASLQFEIDNNSNFSMVQLKPAYQKFIEDQEDSEQYRNFYSLLQKYYNGISNPDIALKNISTYFLEHGCKVPKTYAMMHPDLILKTNAILTEIWSYLKSELQATWVKQELFEANDVAFK